MSRAPEIETRASAESAAPVAEAPSGGVLPVLLENRDRFLAFLTARVGSGEIAEELLQDALIKAVERGGQVRDDESIVAWFFRLLKNSVVDLHRRRDAARRGLERFARELETTAAAPNEPTREVCRCIGGVLETLEPQHQGPIRAIDLEGRELRAFASEGGLTPNHAAVRLHRARAALAQRLRATCGACADRGCVDCSCDHRGA